MEKRLRLISFALLVHFNNLSYAQLHEKPMDQLSDYGLENAHQIREKVQNLLHSITTNNMKKSEMYRGILQRDVAIERQAFDTMKQEFQNDHQKARLQERSETDKRMELKKRETNVKYGTGKENSVFRNHAWKTVRAAGYVVFRRLSNAIEYLVLQANYGDRHWSPPKGEMNPGENETSAAMREVFEECGFSENDLKVIPGFEQISHYLIRNRTKSLVCWLAELKDPNKKIKLSDEHSQYKWVPVKEACELVEHPEAVTLMTAAHEFLLGNATRLEKHDESSLKSES